MDDKEMYATLNNLTITQLKKICKNNNLRGFSKLRKNELMNYIVDKNINITDYRIEQLEKANK